MTPERGIRVSHRKSRGKKLETYHAHGLEDSIVLRNFILSKLIYRFNAVPIKNPRVLKIFIEIDKSILIFIWKFKHIKYPKKSGNRKRILEDNLFNFKLL